MLVNLGALRWDSLHKTSNAGCSGAVGSLEETRMSGHDEQLEELIGLARAGDLAAYGRLVGRFQQMAYSYCYSVLGDFHLAEDAAQEAFIEACGTLSTLREPRAFASWFRRILIKQCDRIIRRPGQRAGTAAIGESLSRPAPSAEDRLQDAELQTAVLHAVRQLPDRERLVTTLFYMDGYSLSQVARFLEVPEGTVKSRLNASRKRLRESVGIMVEKALNSNPLPERFADIVIEARVVEDRIVPMSERMRSLNDEELVARHRGLRERFATAGRDAGLVEAMALAREATRRATGLELYPMQLIGALFLERGWIAEMRSGEGKTLTIIPAAYALAAQGRKVHILTPNDYLARRDAEMAAPILQRLGTSVGWIDRGSLHKDRQAAHACEIVYLTATEAAFDHLHGRLPARDAAIVDDADSVLIDDAPTTIAAVADAKGPGPSVPDTALQEGEDYLVRGGRILAIDPVLGRHLDGRILADGLQQALEHRHGLSATPMTTPVASVTIGDFLRGYRQLSGLTGTALLRKDLLASGYKLEAVAVPTHRDNRLIEHPDRIYPTDAARCEAAITEALQMAREGRPVLLACPTIAMCQKLSALLRARGVSHGRLDGDLEMIAHEGEIIARAGQPGAVTVATAAAGRGTDIAVAADAGGLHVIGVGRHASRRVDVQFTRRAARQGQVGSYRFLMAADDPAVSGLGLVIQEGSHLEDQGLTDRIAQAQQVLEDEFLAQRPRYLVAR
jgi:RNA polymerase sigma factor (sigma-70 family)